MGISSGFVWGLKSLEKAWILNYFFKALKMNQFVSHFAIFFKTAKKPFLRFLMTAKIHSDHEFILWSQQVGLLHVYMLVIKQNLFFECLYHSFTWFAVGLEKPTFGPWNALKRPSILACPRCTNPGSCQADSAAEQLISKSCIFRRRSLGSAMIWKLHVVLVWKSYLRSA